MHDVLNYDMRLPLLLPPIKLFLHYYKLFTEYL